MASATTSKGLLDGPNPLSARDVEARTGLPAELLVSLRRALGLAVPDLDEPAFSEIDVEAARIVTGFHGAGLPAEALLEAARPLGMGLAQCARAGVGLLERVATLDGGATPASEEIAGELTELTADLAPLLGLMLLMHVRAEVRHRSVAAGGDGAARLIYAGFVDMVEFTRLGEEVAVSAVGEVVSEFADIVVGVAEPPTRLVKTIGDEAMFVSPAGDALLATLRRVLGDARRTRPRIPPLRAGVAGGIGLSREGDWFGPSVNLASRLTGAARPNTVLANLPVVEAAPELPWRPRGTLALRGIEEGVEAFELDALSPG